MGTGTLSNRSAGQVILDTFFNDIHGAMDGDFVGRNTLGVPTSNQNLGTTAIPWGVIRASSLVLNGNAIDTSQITSVPNRVVSGKTRTTSNQPAFITPTGSAASLTIFASTTNLVLNINGAAVTVNTDIVQTGLTTAPSSNNTCLVNDNTATGQADTKLWGEFGHRKEIAYDTAGTNITNLNGKFAVFKLTSGANTEFFLAFVDNTNSKLTKCLRGFFYDSSLNPKNRIAFADNDVITLMKTGFVFVENNGTTVDVSYNFPTYSFTSPSSPATGDYWYDLANNVWKRYDGAAFQIINRTLVGMVVMDSTNCVAARCEAFYANHDSFMELEVEKSTTEIVRVLQPYSKVTVYGNKINFQNSLPTWNMTTDLAGSADMYNATEQASTIYQLYITDTGKTVLSDIEAQYRPDLSGWYHPHNPWRSVGFLFNDNGSDVNGASARGSRLCDFEAQGVAGYGSTNTRIRKFTTKATDIGAAWTHNFATTMSTTNGLEMTIVEPDFYDILFTDIYSGGSYVGVSIDSTQLTTAIPSVTAANILGIQDTANTNKGATITIPGVFLKAGQVVRPHTEGSTTGAGTPQKFRITKSARGRF